MFVGPDFLRRDDLPPVAIVGSGPAGLTLALKLAEAGIASLVLEAGSETYSEASQNIYQGHSVGDPYFALDVTRLRFLGGSSNHWGGWCRPLDAEDFEARPDLDIPAWPISRADLDPYAAQTQAILELPPTEDRPEGDSLMDAHFTFSPPVRFGEKYRETLRTSRLIHVALETPVLSLAASGGRITAVRVRDATGAETALSPRHVVLACGGIENSRLLLWSNRTSPEPVVPRADTLGRYWMEHPVFDAGAAILERPFQPRQDGYGISFIAVRRDILRAHGILSGVVRFHPVRRGGVPQRVREVLCAVEPALVEAPAAALGTGARCGAATRITWEQAPDVDNRIELSDTETDRYGVPRPVLHWRKTETDYRTAKALYELVAREVLSSGRGVMRAERHLIEMGGYPLDDEQAGHHHMGGTRMSAAPGAGIVDADLRIHGMANAWVAGSSVFVRGGYANPTYTIVQLALRLGDRLAAELS